ncbi:hypothetical protein [Facklamia sp. 7083-14-GEN3]|uniref:hypothetical protein n=1 Tax=Facklamia sp. 7083-14-GEN3 TaxID=2973478 RepID=UPI00215B79DA|nr:hypothetical protein [Facklamia sp. 7083-14-GEN3]MCR8969632.1 hypothetical protein [Facklamia sp. 7083-14-GEN3]
MLSESIGKLKRHYGYFMGVILITFAGTLLIDRILGMFSPVNNQINQLIANANETMTPDQLAQLSQDVFKAQYTGVGGLIALITMILSAFLRIMQKRSYFQKLNFPEMRIADSAFFHTSPVKIITLPIKSFFANVLGWIAGFLLLTVSGLIIFQLSQYGNTASLVSVLIFMLLALVLSVFLVPISYLIAYDVEGKYNFWATFTKSLSVAKNNFGRMAKSLIVILLIFIAFFILIGLLGFVIIDGLGIIVTVGLLVFLAIIVLIFWVGPLVEVYMVQTLNHIFNREY